MESEEISVHKGQGQKLILDGRNLETLRQHYIKNRHEILLGGLESGWMLHPPG